MQLEAARLSQATRKNVTAMCTSGDVTRMRELLRKQTTDKKMRQFDKLKIPQEAIIEALKMNEY